MKVLILTSEMRIGGTCRDAVEWANRLAGRGDFVVLIAQSATGEGVDRLSPAVKLDHCLVNHVVTELEIASISA